MNIEFVNNCDCLKSDNIIIKIKECIGYIFGNNLYKSKYIKKVVLNTQKDSEKSIEIDEKNKILTLSIEESNNFIFYEVCKQLQHIKNVNKKIYDTKVSIRYPFVYKFIDEYLCYSNSMEYVLNTQVINDPQEVLEYKNYLLESIKGFNSYLIDNVHILKEILSINCLEEGEEIIEESGVSDLITKTAYILAVINVIKLKDFDIELSTLLIELDTLEAPITTKDCKLIQSSLDIVVTKELVTL